MKYCRRSLMGLVAMASALLAAGGIAKAETYPSRPITMIEPFPAGGPADVFSRVIAQRMQKALGQPVIIENIVGAAGTIGAGKVARAIPDGYTSLIGPGFSTHIINPAIYNLSYDTLTDFEPVALLTTIPNLIVANKDIPANDLKSLIAWLKANPDKALQGTSGIGSIGYLAGVLFQKETGARY